MQGVADAERGFETSLKLLTVATDADDVITQFSNLLHHLYRLSELAKGSRDPKSFYLELYQQGGGEVAGAVLWTRNFDTHDVVRVAEPQDIYGDIYTDLYDALAWKPRSQLPVPDSKRYPPYGRDLLYDVYLAGKPALDTSLVARDAIRAVVIAHLPGSQPAGQ
jgi:hypothetical protein